MFKIIILINANLDGHKQLNKLDTIVLNVCNTNENSKLQVGKNLFSDIFLFLKIYLYLIINDYNTNIINEITMFTTF